MVGCHLVLGAGDWVQQEQPQRVTELRLEFLPTTGESSKQAFAVLQAARLSRYLSKTCPAFTPVAHVAGDMLARYAVLGARFIEVVQTMACTSSAPSGIGGSYNFRWDLHAPEDDPSSRRTELRWSIAGRWTCGRRCSALLGELELGVVASCGSPAWPRSSARASTCRAGRAARARRPMAWSRGSAPR